MIKSGSMGLPHVRTSRLCGSAPLTANLSWPWGLAGRYLLSSLCVAVLHVLRESVGCLGNLITGALTLTSPPRLPKKYFWSLEIKLKSLAWDFKAELRLKKQPLV